jgi:predicted regulator of Ras-like GTPase activity (Roadblock/LC7/MglB family)
VSDLTPTGLLLQTAATGTPQPGALAQLRDVPGIEGSFVVSDMGRLLARDMPPVFDDDVLGEVGPRALRLRDTLGYAGEDLDSAVVRYADYLFFLRPLNDGVLCVLTTQSVNVPAVKMAMNLCARRVEGRPIPAGPSKTAPGEPVAVVMKTPEGPAFSGRSRGYGF